MNNLPADRRNSLRGYIPGEIAQKIMAAGGLGERRTVTVLFCDVVGSTPIGERLGPERSKVVMDQVLGRMIAAVSRYEGTVTQLRGDGLLAFFGAPLAHEDDAERAVRAALNIKDALVSYSRDLEAAYGLPLQVRIGVNTGPVVVARVIDVLEVAYNALGDTVNTAARLESAASPGMILASEATSRLIAPLFEVQPVGPLSLRGKEGPVAAVQIIGIRTVTGKARGIAGLTSPLVGRDHELALLQESVKAASEGRGQIVAVIGEAGIGKSRLAADAQRESPEIRWLEGRCLSYAANIPYLPFLDLLREWLEVTAADHEAKVRIELRSAIDLLFAGRADEVYPYLAAMLRLPLEPEAAACIADLSAESLQHQTFTVMREWAIRLAADRPVALILDDIHWADATSLALLEALLDVTEQAPVLLTVLLRPEREHGSWRLNDLARQRYPHRHVEILLRPLTDIHAGQLVNNLLATPGFPGEVRDQILMKAEGNPFFVEEVVRGLIESGTLVQEGDEWRTARPVTALDIPDSIQAVLVSRIDRLSDEARRVLQAASVVGRHFPLDVLKTILAENGKVDSALVDLQRLEMVLERRRIPQPEYRFKHALTQEVAYATLIEAERRRLHREVARALEAQYAGRLEEIYGLLAYHYDQSQEEERALHFLVRAGDKSRAEYADAEALRHYARAVELMRQRGEWEAAAKTLMKAALAYHIALDYAAANQAYREAFEILDRLPPPAPSPLPSAELRWAMLEPQTIDNTGVVTPMSANVAHQVFEGLLRHDQGLNVTPAAARSWEISTDGMRYVFRLYQDRAWSDGRPVTAHDFVFAWLRALRGAQSTLLHDITGAKRFQQGATDDPASVGVRALDDHTLEVVLDGPRAYFPFLLAHPAAHPYPRWTIERFGDDWTVPGHLVGNGPYLIADWESGKGARLVANPRYAGPRSGNTGEVRFIFKDVRDPALFAEGKADVQWPFAHAEDHAARFREYLHLDPPHRILYIFFRCDRQPFNDRRLRLAFAHATDQQTLARTAGVYAIPADGAFVPPPIAGHSPHTAVPFDLMRARQLLAEAGVPHGQGLEPFNLLVPPAGEAPIYEVLTKTWKEILGVEVTVTVRGLGYLEEIYANPPALGRLAWLGDTPDPDNFLRVNFHSASDSPTRWKSARFDTLVEEAQASTDHRRRMALYHEADRLLVAEEAVVIPLLYTRTAALVQPYVRGWWSTFLSPSRIADLIVEREDSTGTPEGTPGRNMNHRTIR